MKFEQIQKEVGKYLIITKKTDYILDIMLAVAISVDCDKPLWIMIQAPSSSGKSKYLEMLDGLPDFHKLFSLTSKALFSGNKYGKGGYIPELFEEKGILCFPDFTHVLSTRSIYRNEIFSQLRMIYDGEAGRATGVDVECFKTWHGKISLIIGVTDAIEKVKSKMTDLGERFLYYRYDNSGIILNDFHYKICANDGKQKKIIQDLINQFVKEKRKTGVETTISPKTETWIKDASQYIAQARSVVERDSYMKEINYVFKPEAPFRLIIQLSNFYVCLITVNGNESRTHNILKEIVISSVPEIRMNIINLISVANIMTTSKLSNELGYTKNIIRRELEDLVAQKIIVKKTSDDKADKWSLSPEFRKLHLNVFN